MKQFLRDLLHPTEAYDRKREEFLKQYKKSYSERTIAENIVCEAHFKINFVRVYSLELRYLGAIECALVLEGILDPGKCFNYMKHETYKDMINRLGTQYLKDKNIL